MPTTVITSAQNARIKQLMLLQQKSSERREKGLFVVEGIRETAQCAEAGFPIDTLFVCPDIYNAQGGRLPFSPDSVRECIEVPAQLYQKMAYRGTTEGVMAVARMRHDTLDNLPLPPSPLLIVLESVEKPGNVGAVLRTADAAKADAVIVCDPLTDLYNPNLIRASLGARFTVPTIACSSEECIAFLKKHAVTILTAQLQDSKPYYDTDMLGPTAIVMGTESTGLTDQWRRHADAHIRIPMLGRVDSLNVSVSAAILLFEAVRQRQCR